MSYALTDLLQPSSALAFAGEAPVSRAELVDSVWSVVQILQDARRAKPNATRVVLACERRAPFAAALFGIWQAGLCAELPPDGQPETIERLRRDPDALVVLSDTSIGSDVVHRTPEPLRAIQDDEPLVVLHTSGTTATPRRFVKTARALLGETAALHHTFGNAPATFLATVAPQHLYGLLFGLLLPLRRGATLVDRPALFPDDVLAALEAHQVTTLVSTPTHLRALASSPRSWPKGLTVLTSSAPLPAELHDKLTRDLGWIVHDVLGSTETGGIATRSAADARWQPLAGVTVRALSDERLALSSAWSSVAESDDRIALFPDGTFEHRGRHGDVVKVGGKRVELSVVEAALRKIAGVTDAAVLACDDSMRGQRLVAFVAGLDTENGAMQVRAELAREFDPLLVPRRVVVGELPREPNGKLRRERLLDALAAPVVQERDLLVVAGSPYFEGHFEGAPVYPGAALLADLAGAARSSWPDLGRVVRLHRIRFQRPLGPGARLRVRLRRENRAVQFEVLAGSESAVSVTGRLDFAEAIP